MLSFCVFCGKEADASECLKSPNAMHSISYLLPRDYKVEPLQTFMLLHDLGTKVKLGDVPCVVVGILINRDMSVQYKVNWWGGNDLKEGWCYPESIEFTDSPKLQIGFRK